MTTPTASTRVEWDPEPANYDSHTFLVGRYDGGVAINVYVKDERAHFFGDCAYRVPGAPGHRVVRQFEHGLTDVEEIKRYAETLYFLERE